MIFISSPYSHPDKSVVENRFESTCELVAKLLNKGHYVMSPIVHGHNLLKYDLPGDWEFWQGYCIDMIKRCEEVWVYNINGWEDSSGVKGEIEVAKKIGKRVFLINNDGIKIKEI
jgi:hypothetical protein